MMPPKDDTIVRASATHHDEPQPNNIRTLISPTKLWSRQRYMGSVAFNLGAFILPALYSTLSKIWVANIDASKVVTTDVYTYIGTLAEVINEGLPRAAWLIIGNKTSRSLAERLGLSYTLISVQIILGTIMSIVFVSAATQFAESFVPVEVRASSLTYVRISSFSALSSSVEVAVSACTRALDRPDVPLIISSAKFVINIILDMLIISKFHIGSHKPSVNTQVTIRLICDMSASLVGLIYFLFISIQTRRRTISSAGRDTTQPKPAISFSALRVLVRPGSLTFIESAIRNALYLWLVSGIVSMGSNYATAWGVFNTIRWGLVMAPVQALEASSLTFVGHEWGSWRAAVGDLIRRPKASRQDLKDITRPVFISCIIALAFEVPLCIFLAEWGAVRFAYYLSESVDVSRITAKMWKTIDWTYIFYALSTQVATILLATRPIWYLYQSLASNILWVLPWAIAVSRIGITPDDAWTYHSIIFGGSLVFSFFDVSLFVCAWAWRLGRGKMRLPPVQH